MIAMGGTQHPVDHVQIPTSLSLDVAYVAGRSVRGFHSVKRGQQGLRRGERGGKGEL